MARLTITAHARADLQEIHSRIAKDKPEAAKRFLERLRAKARQLAETPGMGRSRVESFSYASSMAGATCRRFSSCPGPLLLRRQWAKSAYLDKNTYYTIMCIICHRCELLRQKILMPCSPTCVGITLSFPRQT